MDELLAQIDTLTVHDLLILHREVCRRAARVYAVTYRQVRDRNFAAAMADRDTRFVKGLSAIENVERSHRLGRLQRSA